MKKIFVISALAVVVIAVSVFVFTRKSVTQPTATQQQTGATTTQSEPAVDLFPDDSDRDGISNAEEKKLGLDPTEFDTDGDGLSDATEISVWKTDPKKADTDGDGFLDGAEVFDGYNPLGPGKL